MESVTIASSDYPSYDTVAEADEYLLADFTATSWPTATDDQKGAALVTATRLIDRQSWISTANTQDLRYAIQAFKDACCILASNFINGSTTELTSSSTDPGIQILKAGSAMIEYFRQAPDSATRFSTEVQELLGPYMAGNCVDVAVGYAGGTDQCEALRNDHGLWRPL